MSVRFSEKESAGKDEIRQRALQLKTFLSRWAERKGLVRPVSVVVAVKGRSVQEIQPVVESGFTILGENRLQEFFYHQPYFPEVQWHYIGTLQSRKIPQILRHFSLIHSVDSWEHCQKMQKIAEREGFAPRVLIEVNVGKEPTKSGIFPEDFFPFLEKIERFCPRLVVEGLMSLPPLLYPVKRMRTYYEILQRMYHQMRERYPEREIIFSAGTTDDFELALEMDANMIRLGRYFFEKGREGLWNS
ncbi:MAG: YggS family pyridoxal phosphate-dependent enzyme [bacterium JZ-2024 1]